MTMITLCLPSFEPATRYMSGFLKRYALPKIIKNFSFRSISLFRYIDRREVFSSTAPHSDLIIGTGHGGSDVLTGQFLNVLWEVNNYNPEECKGKIIKFVSCETGAELGPDLIKNGAKAFQGYTKIYSFYVDLTVKHYLFPWIDSMARKFLMPPVKGINALLDGKTNKEAYDVEMEAWQEQIDLEEDPEMKSILEHNRNSFIMLGDPEAKI